MKLPEDIRTVMKTSTCLYTKDQVEAALDHMAQEMNQKLANSNPIFLCVVLGGIIPMGNLLPRLDFPLELDYVHATRYKGKTRGADIVWKAKPSCVLKDRTVVIVDDVLDGGLTLKAIVEFCEEQGAKEIFSAALVDKPSARLPSGVQKLDFSGLEVPNRYVFGYGMDYKEYLRNAPGIFAIAPEHE
jgi:hypoxanthine phosphoribosyltransferase